MFNTFVMFEEFNEKVYVLLGPPVRPALLPPGFDRGRHRREAYGLAILVSSSATDCAGQRHL
jgi:hypothetical protein